MYDLTSVKLNIALYTNESSVLASLVQNCELYESMLWGSYRELADIFDIPGLCDNDMSSFRTTYTGWQLFSAPLADQICLIRAGTEELGFDV